MKKTAETAVGGAEGGKSIIINNIIYNNIINTC